jgi:SAM-dependent methyltransferase
MPYYGHKAKKISIWNYLPNLTLPNERHLHSFIKRLAPDAVIVDIGSGGRALAPNIITFDKFVTENTRVVGDIHQLPFEDSSIDCIICTGTLEHIEDPWKASREFHRVLKKKGYCYIAVPFMQGYHPDPHDYWRFTLEGLEVLFKDFTTIEKGVLQGSGSGLSWALIDFFRAFSDNKYLSEALGIVARIVFLWVKFFDIILKKKYNNKLFASGNYFIGEKE